MKEIITKQLLNKSPLHSLQIQNHIYGCFILMEDLAQGIVSLDGNVAAYQDRIFDIDGQFSDIGLKYGFVISDDLSLKIFEGDYKNKWIDTFKSCDMVRDVNLVDSMEDDIIELIRELVPSDMNFFDKALETGRLSDEWLDRVLDLIEDECEDSYDADDDEKKEEANDTVQKENEDLKPIKKKLNNTRRKFKRQLTPSNIKRILNKTRRHIK